MLRAVGHLCSGRKIDERYQLEATIGFGFGIKGYGEFKLNATGGEYDVLIPALDDGLTKILAELLNCLDKRNLHRSLPCSLRRHSPENPSHLGGEDCSFGASCARANSLSHVQQAVRPAALKPLSWRATTAAGQDQQSGAPPGKVGNGSKAEIQTEASPRDAHPCRAFGILNDIQARKPAGAALGCRSPEIHPGGNAMSRAYNVVDADGHILEPLDLWAKYIDPAYRDRAPRIVK